MSQARAARRAKGLERPHDRRPNPGLAPCPALRLALSLAKSLSLSLPLPIPFVLAQFLPLPPDCLPPGAAARPPGATTASVRCRCRRRPRPTHRSGPGSSASKSPVSDAVDAARVTTSSRDEVSISNASELEVTEWGIHDEPRVYITVRELADGTRELRRVCFSRERFAELNAKLWWEENKERIQAQYL